MGQFSVKILAPEGQFSVALNKDWFDRLIDRLGRTLDREGEPASALRLFVVIKQTEGGELFIKEMRSRC
jgi:hypothetical protein